MLKFIKIFKYLKPFYSEPQLQGGPSTRQVIHEECGNCGKLFPANIDSWEDMSVASICKRVQLFGRRLQEFRIFCYRRVSH